MLFGLIRAGRANLPCYVGIVGSGFYPVIRRLTALCSGFLCRPPVLVSLYSDLWITFFVSFLPKNVDNSLNGSLLLNIQFHLT